MSMNVTDFYAVFDEFMPLLKEHGLNKKARGRFDLRNKFTIEVILDEWGWDHENGWGFFLRVVDKLYEDQYGIFDYKGVVDISPLKVIDEHLLPSSVITHLYVKVPKSVYMKFEEGSWVTFYNPDNLRDILSELLPSSLEYIDKWTSHQNSKKPPAPRNTKRPSKSELAKIQKEIKELQEDI